jgi:hypothetical protein
MAVDQRIKVTLGITGLLSSRVHIDGLVWHLDVDSSYPGAARCPKGLAVRQVKRYVSWVKYDVNIRIRFLFKRLFCLLVLKVLAPFDNRGPGPIIPNKELLL